MMYDYDLLDPCPFCGSKAEIIQYAALKQAFKGSCTNRMSCGAMVGWFLSRDRVIQTWNKRYEKT